MGILSAADGSGGPATFASLRFKSADGWLLEVVPIPS
jgi:hypothetical protein